MANMANMSDDSSDTVKASNDSDDSNVSAAELTHRAASLSLTPPQPLSHYEDPFWEPLHINHRPSDFEEVLLRNKYRYINPDTVHTVWYIKKVEELGELPLSFDAATGRRQPRFTESLYFFGPVPPRITTSGFNTGTAPVCPQQSPLSNRRAPHGLISRLRRLDYKREADEVDPPSEVILPRYITDSTAPKPGFPAGTVETITEADITKAFTTMTSTDSYTKFRYIAGIQDDDKVPIDGGLNTQEAIPCSGFVTPSMKVDDEGRRILDYFQDVNGIKILPRLIPISCLAKKGEEFLSHFVISRFWTQDNQPIYPPLPVNINNFDVTTLGELIPTTHARPHADAHHKQQQQQQQQQQQNNTTYTHPHLNPQAPTIPPARAVDAANEALRASRDELSILYTKLVHAQLVYNQAIIQLEQAHLDANPWTSAAIRKKYAMKRQMKTRVPTAKEQPLENDNQEVPHHLHPSSSRPKTSYHPIFSTHPKSCIAAVAVWVEETSKFAPHYDPNEPIPIPSLSSSPSPPAKRTSLGRYRDGLVDINIALTPSSCRTMSAVAAKFAGYDIPTLAQTWQGQKGHGDGRKRTQRPSEEFLLLSRICRYAEMSIAKLAAEHARFEYDVEQAAQMEKTLVAKTRCVREEIAELKAGLVV